jgi:hypothetical protein
VTRYTLMQTVPRTVRTSLDGGVERCSFVTKHATVFSSLGKFMHAARCTPDSPLTYVYKVGQLATIVCFEVQR